MKPKLETTKDVAIKDKIKGVLEEYLKHQILDLYEPLYVVDWFANDKLFIEFKSRSYDHDTFGSLMLSLHKWLTLKNYVRNGFEAALCILWTDGVYYMNINESSTLGCRYGAGGRKDRLIEGDVEPCVFIPVSKFTKIGEAQ